MKWSGLPIKKGHKTSRRQGKTCHAKKIICVFVSSWPKVKYRLPKGTIRRGGEWYRGVRIVLFERRCLTTKSSGCCIEFGGTRSLWSSLLLNSEFNIRILNNEC